MPDFFLDVEDFVKEKEESPANQQSQPITGSGDTVKTFQSIQEMMTEDLVKSMGGIFIFNLSGELCSLCRSSHVLMLISHIMNYDIV